VTKDAAQRSIWTFYQAVGGYTLLELLIAITIIAVVVIIIGGAMRLGFRSVDAGERKIEALERLRTSLGIIDAQIQSAYFLPAAAQETDSATAQFKGEHELLQLPTNYSLWSGEAGSVMVTYRVEQDKKGGKALYASESMMGGYTPREIKLIDGLQEISFDYFFKGPTDEKGSWVEQWTDEQTMPEKIRVNLLRNDKELTRVLPLRGCRPAGTVVVKAKPA
jgi:general secretion pathway protein J